MAYLEMPQLIVRGADPLGRSACRRKQRVVANCIHAGWRASTCSWPEASSFVDEALGPPRPRAMPAATKVGGNSRARAAQASRSSSVRIVRSPAGADDSDQK